MRRERIARLPAGHDEARRVRVGEVVDRAQARRMPVGEWLGIRAQARLNREAKLLGRSLACLHISKVLKESDDQRRSIDSVNG